MHDRDRASHRIVEACQRGNRIESSRHHGGDASFASPSRSCPGRGGASHQVVRDNGRVARIVQLPEVERDTAVLATQ